MANTAAWLIGPKAYPFKIAEAPMGVPKSHQILIKNHAIAINPINGKIQSLAFFPVAYPTVIGEDVAGQVVEVGEAVTRFEIGDRVIGMAAGHKTKQDGGSAFQTYTVLHDDLVCRIPDDLSFQNAVVLPLGLSTASCGLFHANFLKLDCPTEPPRPDNGKTLLVMGGASSVGSNAIQLAKAAGYNVITTASKKNLEHVAKLGASRGFDYSDAAIVDNITKYLRGKTLIGVFDAIGGPALKTAIDVVGRLRSIKLIATVLPVPADVPDDVMVKQVQALYIMDNEVGKAVWEDFLPHALESGRYQCAPEALVAGHGLESLQHAVDLKQEGISAKKVVVTLT